MSGAQPGIIGSYRYPYSTTPLLAATGRYWQLMIIWVYLCPYSTTPLLSSTVNYWQILAVDGGYPYSTTPVLTVLTILLADTGSYWQILAVYDKWGLLMSILNSCEALGVIQY